MIIQKITIKKIIKKYNLEKTNEQKDGKFLSICYDYKLYLSNLKTNWYIKFEKPTRACKFYTVYTRFENIEISKKINEFIKCNTDNGKCNRFCDNLNEINCFLSNVIFFNKCYKKAV